MTKPMGVEAIKTGTVVAWLQQREDEMAALLAELVAIRTENPPGKNYRVCADFLENRLKRVGLECERLEVIAAKEGTVDASSCLIAWYGRGERVLYFHGHYDVVPAQSPEQFQPVRKEHFLFGRGSCDMKGGIVAMLYAILALRECGAEPGGRIALVLVPNEETGGEGGSAWLAAQGRLGHGGIGMLLAEPTSGVVWNANRGAISLRVRIHGKSAHVGLQQTGVNAFEQMLRVTEELRKLKVKVEKRKTRYRVVPQRARNSILMMGGEFAGGSNFNVVPEVCSFTVDRRINPEEDLAVERAELMRVFEKLKRKGIRLEAEIFQEGNSGGSGE